MINVSTPSLRALLGVTIVTLFWVSGIGCRHSPEKKGAKFLDSGKRHFDAKDYPRALLQFQNAADALPKDAEPYYRMGLTYWAIGDARAAVAHLGKSVQLNPQHTAAQIRLSELMAASHDASLIETAQKQLHQVLATSPDNPDALNALALTEWQRGNSAGAERYLRRVLDRFPDNMKTLVALTRIKLRQNDYSGAEAVLRRATFTEPISADAIVALSEFLFLTGKTEEGQSQLQRVLQLDPDNSFALLDIAGIRHRAGRTEEAAALYKRLSETSKEHRSFHAIYLFQIGRREEAIEKFKKLHDEHPHDRVLRDRLISAYLASDRAPDAQKLLAAALRKNPKDIDGRLHRSVLYLQVGNNAAAQADLAEVVRLSPDSASAHYLLSKIHQRQGSPMRQREELAEALRLDPGMLTARIELAELLVTGKAPKEALKVIDGAPYLQANHVARIEQRNSVLAALGDREALREGIDQGLRFARTPKLLSQEALWQMQARKYSLARQALEEALSLAPGNLRLLMLLADTYIQNGELAVGAAQFRHQVTANPRSASLRYVLAQLLMRNGNIAEAEKEFSEAYRANPKFTPAAIAFAQTELRYGRMDRSREVLSAVVATEPLLIPARLMLAQVESASGNAEAAIDHYRAVLASGRDNSIVLNNLAYRLAETGRADEALPYAQRAKELAPEDPTITHTLGWVLYRKGLYVHAVREFQQAVAAEVTPVRMLHLGVAYFKSGNQQRGRETVLAAVRLNPSMREHALANEVIGGQQ